MSLKLYKHSVKADYTTQCSTSHTHQLSIQDRWVLFITATQTVVITLVLFAISTGDHALGHILLLEQLLLLLVGLPGVLTQNEHAPSDVVQVLGAHGVDRVVMVDRGQNRLLLRKHALRVAAHLDRPVDRRALHELPRERHLVGQRRGRTTCRHHCVAKCLRHAHVTPLGPLYCKGAAWSALVPRWSSLSHAGVGVACYSVRGDPCACRKELLAILSPRLVRHK